MTRSPQLFGILLICLAVVSPLATAQVDWLTRFLRADSMRPESKEYSAMLENLGRATSDEIEEGFPAVESAANSNNLALRIEAALFLFEVARLNRHGELLERHLPVLFALMNDSEIGVQRASFLAFVNMVPRGKDRIVPKILEYLKGPNARFPAGAVNYLGWVARDQDEPWVVVERLMNDPLTSEEEKNGILSGMAFPYLKDRPVRIAVAALDSPGLREQAVQTISRMGILAISVAYPKLDALAQDPNQPESIRTPAKEALDRLQRGY